uniref:Cerebellin 10 n=1 Tax=Neogobius melanostomus TaxID=47308 RepID=A0A8C6UIF2_9GOBI
HWIIFSVAFLLAQTAALHRIEAWSNVTETQVQTLTRDRAVGQVAFSASLLASGSGHTGPFNTDTTLVFRGVVSNIGNAYNPHTGIFTAPVRGAYHFEFYLFFQGGSHDSRVGLTKNMFSLQVKISQMDLALGRMESLCSWRPETWCFCVCGRTI